MAIKYAAESYDQVIDEIKPILFAQHDKMSVHGFDLDPDYNVYSAASKLGRLIVYTARDDGKLVGYIVNFVGKNHHYKTKGWATGDVIWLQPESRKPTVGNRLLEFMENDLRERTASVVEIAKREGTEDSEPLGRLLEARGYVKVATLYAKRLQ